MKQGQEEIARREFAREGFRKKMNMNMKYEPNCSEFTISKKK